MIEASSRDALFGAFILPGTSYHLAGTRLRASRFLSPDARDALEDIVEVTRFVKANTDVVREGEQTDRLFIFTHGWAVRCTSTIEGRRRFPAVLVRGDVGNLDSLLFERLDYGVRTITPATVVALPRDRAVTLSARYPGIAQTFTWLALIEKAMLSKSVLSLGRQSARERLAHFLCELSVRLKAIDGNASSFDFPFTQAQIADALGLTSVHVNRTLRRLRHDGMVAIANRTMILPDVRGLGKIGGFDPRYLDIDPPAEMQSA